jgi:16S rRNA (uracil1498-N3)-methyltransferase
MKNFQFFINREDVRENDVTIRGELVHKIKNVLRYKAGDEITLIVPVERGSKRVFGEIREISDAEIAVKIVREEVLKEAALFTTLYLSLIKSKYFEAGLQKATELGVKRIVPVAAKRSLVKLPAGTGAKKMARWKAIVTEAASQCKRGDIPEITGVTDVFALSKIEDDADIKIVCDETGGLDLKELLRGHEAPLGISAAVGPEGGFTREETQALNDLGFKSVLLFRNILRAETVPIFLMSVFQYELNDL